jgi:hypothetical protein
MLTMRPYRRFDHPRHHRAGHLEHGGDVDVHAAPPLAVRYFVHQPRWLVMAGLHHAGIVDHDVDGPQRTFYRLHQRLDLIRLHQVRHMREGALAQLLRPLENPAQWLT